MFQTPVTPKVDITSCNPFWKCIHLNLTKNFSFYTPRKATPELDCPTEWGFLLISSISLFLDRLHPLMPDLLCAFIITGFFPPCGFDGFLLHLQTRTYFAKTNKQRFFSLTGWPLVDHCLQALRHINRG